MAKRLTNSVRVAVIESVLANTFKEKNEALEKHEADIAARIYALVVGGRKPIMDSLPKDYFMHTNTFELAIDGYTDDERPRRMRLRMDTYQPMPAYVGPGSYLQILTLKPDHVLARMCLDLEAERDRVRDASLALSERLRGVVYSVGTVEKLLEVWPEAKTYLPAEVFAEKTANLPAVLAAELNAAIEAVKAA